MTFEGFATVESFTADHQAAFKEALLASFSSVPGLTASQIQLTISLLPEADERRVLAAAGGGVLITYTFIGVTPGDLTSISAQVERLSADETTSSDFVESFKTQTAATGATIPAGLAVVANSNNPTREPTPIPTSPPTPGPTSMPSKVHCAHCSHTCSHTCSYTAHTPAHTFTLDCSHLLLTAGHLGPFSNPDRNTHFLRHVWHRPNESGAGWKLSRVRSWTIHGGRGTCENQLSRVS
jgi:hypothetical protein